ncbi:MAG: putative metalloprotease CJM1_0395 family protein [Alphaproteobacteria bacterium]|nr:putative metalloprotease CJM1_0395 family protein [Alphaproteobacteria bacterium]
MGPDGKRYATGGEVPIDIAPVPGDPNATIQKLSQVKRAALAPADPSGADRAIAAAASAGIVEARTELAAQRQEESQPPSEEDVAPTTAVEAASAALNGQDAGKSNPAPFSISV